MSRDETTIVQIFVFVVVGILISFVGGPLFAAWVLIKGWDNTGLLVKLGAAIIPLAVLVFVLVDPGSIGSLEMLWLFASPILTYGMLAIAYSRRNQMFNV